MNLKKYADFFVSLRNSRKRNLFRRLLSNGKSKIQEELGEIGLMLPTKLKAAGFDPRLRPQNLSVEDYLRLSAAFKREK